MKRLAILFSLIAAALLGARYDPAYSSAHYSVTFINPVLSQVEAFFVRDATTFTGVGCLCYDVIGATVTCTSVTAVLDKCNSNRTSCSAVSGSTLTLSANDTRQQATIASTFAGSSYGQFRLSGVTLAADHIICDVWAN